jgi:hypothetical protein
LAGKFIILHAPQATAENFSGKGLANSEQITNANVSSMRGLYSAGRATFKSLAFPDADWTTMFAI